MSTTASFRDLMPRVFELRDRVRDPSHPDAYFRDFEHGLAEMPDKAEAFLALERRLQVLDARAWTDLRGRAARTLQLREPGRGWRPLFDIFSEARAFGYLASLGCTEIGFIGRSASKSPDLSATLDGRSVLCEVKALNTTETEARRRRRVFDGEFVVSDTAAHLEPEWLGRLSTVLKKAVRQLDSADPAGEARRVVFVTLHFDDWVGDYYPAYFAQMDAHLLQNPIAGEVVFHLPSNLFGRDFAMRSAVVISD